MASCRDITQDPEAFKNLILSLIYFEKIHHAIFCLSREMNI